MCCDHCCNCYFSDNHNHVSDTSNNHNNNHNNNNQNTTTIIVNNNNNNDNHNTIIVNNNNNNDNNSWPCCVNNIQIKATNESTLQQTTDTGNINANIKTNNIKATTTPEEIAANDSTGNYNYNNNYHYNYKAKEGKEVAAQCGVESLR